MIRMIVYFHFRGGTLEEAAPIAEKLVAATRAEAGCLQYDMLQADADETQVALLETWASQEALDQHGKSEHFTTLVPQLAALCTQPPAMERYHQLL